jgi:hypothetical protein
MTIAGALCAFPILVIALIAGNEISLARAGEEAARQPEKVAAAAAASAKHAADTARAMNSPKPWKMFLDVVGPLTHLAGPIFDSMMPAAEGPIEVVSEGFELCGIFVRTIVEGLGAGEVVGVLGNVVEGAACGGTRQRANKCAIDLHW